MALDTAALGGMVVGLLIAAVIGLLIGAVILRAAVAWYNKMTGDRGTLPPSNDPGYGSGFSPNVGAGYAPDPANPFASPTTTATARAPHAGGVPEPGFLYAAGILLVAFLANLPLGFIATLIAAQAPELTSMINLLSMPIQFLIYAAVFKAMLPTRTFGAAALITLLVLVIWVIIVVVIAVVVGVVFYLGMRA
jgi:hypothetical protein